MKLFVSLCEEQVGMTVNEALGRVVPSPCRFPGRSTCHVLSNAATGEAFVTLWEEQVGTTVNEALFDPPQTPSQRPGASLLSDFPPLKSMFFNATDLHDLSCE